MRITTRPGRIGGGAILALLLVVVIGAFLMFGDMSALLGGSGGGGNTGGGPSGGTSYIGQVGKSRGIARAARLEMNLSQIATTVAIFREQNRRLPRDIAELEIGSAGNDQWGNPVRISFEGPGDATNMRVISAGEDEEFGTEDDLEALEAVPY